MSDLLEIDGLRTHFTVGGRSGGGRQTVRAVDGVSLRVAEGETLGLVGESGCGKSTLGRTIVRLHRPTEGRVLFEGRDLASVSGRELRETRRRAQMVFQDPFSSLDPRKSVQQILTEPLRIHRIGNRRSRPTRVAELLEMVGLRPEMAARYPHEFSGGQRQRIGIARALALEPKMIICDEPVSALDVSVQAQVLNVIERLRDELSLTCLFIAHDLSVVRHVCSRIAVMYLGKVVEIGTREQLFNSPQHPYTQALLSAVPSPDPAVERTRSRIILSGELPSAANPPSGCRFRTRCPLATEICTREEPALEAKASGGLVACHHVPRAHASSANTTAGSPKSWEPA
jgi:oligopeptide/dipeptide ABC transporter ATP-binding protein